MKLKKIGATLLFLLAVGTVFSQSGWINGEIFLNNGETKAGFVKINMVSKDLIAIGGDQTVRFKPAGKGKKKKYRQPEIDHIILKYPTADNASYFEYVTVSDEKKELFRVVSTGTVILYHRHVRMSSNSGGTNGFISATNAVDEYYALRDGETIASPLITGRISKSFRKKAMAYFADCPSLVAKFENRTYRKRDVEKAVEVYNRCAISN